ncbi:phage holin family protein [Paracoccus fistulariae]|uniref:Phage holin family protein n=1 Tax=Paracoccus fistulariae TaxID=658446 RepID=A0ABY7SLL7_9RHOB|nr:phage holin family protein [Paracoccus fistulariae]MDB6179783.1 phage holin family protein [Paracoccus fistulariae]WCR07892.1 phage holin family protein [Paracoccus fistulariae]
MFDYAQKLQLALTDKARRAGMKAAAGTVAAIGVAFLLAALWIWLAYEMDLGAMIASVVLGVFFLVVALIVLLMGGSTRHDMPTTDELRQEVETQLMMVADAASNRARMEAGRVVDMAGRKVSSVVGSATDRVSQVADKAYGVAQSVGFTPENVDRTIDKAGDVKDKVVEASNTNAGSMAKLLGAFAIGVTLASRFRKSRDDDDDYYHDEDDYYDDDRYYR